jgi:hypothetical protein
MVIEAHQCLSRLAHATDVAALRALVFVTVLVRAEEGEQLGKAREELDVSKTLGKGERAKETRA